MELKGRLRTGDMFISVERLLGHEVTREDHPKYIVRDWASENRGNYWETTADLSTYQPGDEVPVKVLHDTSGLRSWPVNEWTEFNDSE